MIRLYLRTNTARLIKMLFLGNILLLFSGCVFVSSSAEMPKSNFKVFITQFFFLLPSNNVRCVYPLHSIVYRSSERKIYVIDKFSIEKHNEKKENHNLTRKRDVSVTFQTCSSSPSLALFLPSYDSYGGMNAGMERM